MATANTVLHDDTHVTHTSAVRPGINAQTPGTMPRAEDDEATRAHSPDSTTGRAAARTRRTG